MSAARRRQPAPPPWWRDAVLYHVYCRSFADSDRDGVGDLRGLIDHLDHLAWLGVDAVWLSPTMPSPDADWGYDVSDYCSVHPQLGTLDDLDQLFAHAAGMGIRVLLDLVPNHTSDRHPWFVDARSSRTARHRDWYVWADPRPDGRPPNNWIDFSGAPAWTFDQATGQWYLHNFLPTMPDLNWWNPEVRLGFDNILRFWFDRGVAGLRIDTANLIVKDRRLRDNPAASAQDHALVQLRGLRDVYNGNRPQGHAVLRRWRRIAEEYDPPRLLLGETWFFDIPRLATYYGPNDDELHLAMNFSLVFAPFLAGELRAVVEETEARLPAWAWPLWFGSNHDVRRMATRWCGDDPARVRCALLILLCLRGTPLLYYGDEIGMANVRIAAGSRRDPLEVRDGARTPMRWTAGGNAGFAAPDVVPWLSIGDRADVNVADQRDDPMSVLHFCHDLIALRRGSSDLRGGVYMTVSAPDDVWAWRRGRSTLVAVNLGKVSRTVPGVEGTIRLSTHRERAGEWIDGPLRLRPWEGVIVAGSVLSTGGSPSVHTG